MTTREPLARSWTTNQAHLVEPDGMTERIEVEGTGWDVVIFVVILLAVLFLLALTTPVPPGAS